MVRPARLLSQNQGMRKCSEFLIAHSFWYGESGSLCLTPTKMSKQSEFLRSYLMQAFMDLNMAFTS